MRLRRGKKRGRRSGRDAGGRGNASGLEEERLGLSGSAADTDGGGVVEVQNPSRRWCKGNRRISLVAVESSKALNAEDGTRLAATTKDRRLAEEGKGGFGDSKGRILLRGLRGLRKERVVGGEAEEEEVWTSLEESSRTIPSSALEVGKASER